MKGILITLLLCASSIGYSFPYEDLVYKYAKIYKVDPMLVRAMMRQESNYKVKAHSTLSNGKPGAYGLMQLMPATAQRFGVSLKDIYKPESNIRGGIKYIAWLQKRFKGNINHVLAGYNAGEGAVDKFMGKKYKGIPPYKETRNYVKRVKRFYVSFKGGQQVRKQKHKRFMAKNNSSFLNVDSYKSMSHYLALNKNASGRVKAKNELVKRKKKAVVVASKAPQKGKKYIHNPQGYTRFSSVRLAMNDKPVNGYLRYRSGDSQ